MKTILFALLIVLASCSSEDPEPQIPCSQLKTEIEATQKAITDHQAKGAQGNQEAWENELSRLNKIKAEKSNEYSRRAC